MALKENEKTILDELKTKKPFCWAFTMAKQLGLSRFEKIPGNLAYITRFGVLPAGARNAEWGESL